MRAITMLAGAAAGLALLTGQAFAADEWVTKTTDRSVAETVAALSEAIETAGASVMATVDHADNAASVGLDLAPTTVVIFGNPKVGTPLMQENRRIAIDLPQKILVWDEDGATRVGYVRPADLAARYDIAADAEPIVMMEKALDRLSGAAVGQ